MPKDYDVEEAFRAIENELINSMMRNLSHHRAEEMKEGLNWTSWQAEQLKALNVYKQKNQKKFTKIFADINRNIEKSILLHRRTGETEQEKAILEAIKKGAKLTHKAGSTIEGAFFRINDRKLDALLNEVNSSMRKAETAMLRMANDQYRKVIFNSQIYYNTGAGTYEKAVDMATKDFLSRGINCIEYKNGARVNIASYAGMALRTANTRAYCQGEGTKRQEWGITTVIVNKRGLPCPKCGRWTGKILIDDVWSGGKASDGPYPLMSQAMAGGLYHPNCKDGHTTYFPGISAKPEKVTKKEMKRAVIAEKQESRDNLIQRNIDKFDRLSNYSLDEENKKKYKLKTNEWKNIQEKYIEREYERGISGKKKYSNVENNVNLKYISSKDFKDKFSDLTDNPHLNEEIFERVKATLIHRNGTNKEDMYLISVLDGDIKGKNVASKVDFEVEYNDSIKEAISNEPSKTLISIHNHPTNLPPTGSDFVSQGRNQYKMGLIACHNGDVYVYEVGNKAFTRKLMDDTIEKYKKLGYNKVKAHEIVLEQFVTDYGIKWRKL